MSWLDIDWKQSLPTNLDIERLWRTATIRPIQNVPAPLCDYLAELRRVMGRAVVYANFEVCGNGEFSWFASRNRWEEIDFGRQFLLHPAVQRLLPEVVDGANFSSSIKIEWLSSFVLDGELARIIVEGGAYEKFEGTPREAKEFGIRVCDALFGDRFLEVLVFRCDTTWSPWFYGRGIDYSCITIDKRLCTVSFLACTNTD